MAVAFLPILPEMRKYCTFSTTLEQSKLTVLMKRPQESATGSGLLAPFHQTVWLLVLTAMVSVGPIIYIFATFRFVEKKIHSMAKRPSSQYYQYYQYRRAKLWNEPESENYGFFSCVWFVYSSLLKQGTSMIATTGTRLPCCLHDILIATSVMYANDVFSEELRLYTATLYYSVFNP